MTVLQWAVITQSSNLYQPTFGRNDCISYINGGINAIYYFTKVLIHTLLTYWYIRESIEPVELLSVGAVVHHSGPPGPARHARPHHGASREQAMDQVLFVARTDGRLGDGAIGVR